MTNAPTRPAPALALRMERARLNAEMFARLAETASAFMRRRHREAEARERTRFRAMASELNFREGE
jgi:hypothetical protein